VKILSVKDSSAEPTGFIFDASGSTAYVSIQHSDDSFMPLVDGYGTDDLIKITGFKVKKNKGQGWW
jgi:secreted PhoX family phosphatase